MKLVKITEPRDGFVYECTKGHRKTHMRKGEKFFIAGRALCSIIEKDCSTYICDGVFVNGIPDKGRFNLIGKIGITHELKDGALTEIPRGEIEVDDVWEGIKTKEKCVVVRKGTQLYPDKDECFIDLVGEQFGEKSVSGIGYKIISEEHMKLIGTLGITHEFVNSKEK